MKKYSIALITTDDPRNKRSWSGTNHFIYRTLEKHFGAVDLLGPYTPQPLKFLCSAFNYFSLRLFNKRFDYRSSFLMRNAYGKHFSSLLKQKQYDFVVVSASIAAAAGLETNLPVIYINDRVVPGAMNYYKILTKLYAFSKRQSLASDKLALEKSTLAVFCSHWAARGAVELHGIAAHKVKVIPFGANFEIIPAAPKAVDFPAVPLRLLFAGVNWQDKGGPVALEALRCLLENGIDTELVILGCTPPPGVQHPKMKVIGFLDKNKPDEFERLMNYFRDSHYFILPTSFEAYGMVFCESAAYGLPALAPATGGIPTIIENKVSGFLLPENSDGKAYAAQIMQLVNHPEQWQAMRAAAYQRFIEKLNWDSWAKTFREMLEEEKII